MHTYILDFSNVHQLKHSLHGPMRLMTSKISTKITFSKRADLSKAVFSTNQRDRPGPNIRTGCIMPAEIMPVQGNP